MSNEVKRLKVTLAGRSTQDLRALTDALSAAPDIVCSQLPISDGQHDALSALHPVPDALVLRFEGDGQAEFSALAAMRADSRPPLIVVGPADNRDAVRMAVRSGARDFLAEPVDLSELIAALEAIRNDPARADGGRGEAQVTVVLGAAGGVGASLVACNVAVALATETGAPTLLLDLDLNLAPLAGLLDLAPERGLPEALAELEYLDDHALQGYVNRHRSGVRLMGAPARSPVSAATVDPAQATALLRLLRANYRHVVIDASRSFDPLTVAALGMARHVVLVLQQSVVQLKQATVLAGWLRSEFGIPRDHVLVVVNRYLKKSPVTLDDIRRALGREELTLLPSHYKSVLASFDSGVPLVEHDRSAPVSRAILQLQRELLSGQHVEKHGLLRRALPIFSGG